MLQGLLYPCNCPCNAKISAITQIWNSRRQHCLLHCLAYPCIKLCNANFLLFHVCLSNSQPRTFAGVPALFLWESPPYHHSIAGVPAMYFLSFAGVPAILFFFNCGSPRHISFSFAGVPAHILFLFNCGSPRRISFSHAGVPALGLLSFQYSLKFDKQI